jgi:hypothetical protein
LTENVTTASPDRRFGPRLVDTATSPALEEAARRRSACVPAFTGAVTSWVALEEREPAVRGSQRRRVSARTMWLALSLLIVNELPSL